MGQSDRHFFEPETCQTGTVGVGLGVIGKVAADVGSACIDAYKDHLGAT